MNADNVETVAQTVKRIADIVRVRAGAEARREASLLVASAFRVDHRRLLTILETKVSLETADRLSILANRRALGEPLQYLLGTWEFMGLPFLVSPAVLIPRPDTELLAEEALRLIAARHYRTALDLCCGSGCIGISVQRHSGIRVTLSDISADAMAIAKQNAVRNEVKATFVQGDLFEPLHAEKFDLILCNPPYLTAQEMKNLQPEVAREPSLALDGGCDGLEFYRRIAMDFKKHLLPGGALLVEIGATQAKEVMRIFETDHMLRDYGGNDRVVLVEGKG